MLPPSLTFPSRFSCLLRSWRRSRCKVSRWWWPPRPCAWVSGTTTALAPGCWPPIEMVGHTPQLKRHWSVQWVAIVEGGKRWRVAEQVTTAGGRWAPSTHRPSCPTRRTSRKAPRCWRGGTTAAPRRCSRSPLPPAPAAAHGARPSLPFPALPCPRPLLTGRRPCCRHHPSGHTRSLPFRHPGGVSDLN